MSRCGNVVTEPEEDRPVEWGAVMAFASTEGRVPDGELWKALPDTERLSAPPLPARAQRLPRGPLAVITAATVLLVGAVAAVFAYLT
jgi:hypothetical protein